MKTSKKIATQFGFSQEDMAMALGISRGLWSMYESGRRNLPDEASRRLDQMHIYMNSTRRARNGWRAMKTIRASVAVNSSAC